MADEITKDSLQIARLEEQLTTVRRDMETMADQMRDMAHASQQRHDAQQAQLERVLQNLAEFKGGRKVLMGLIGASAGLASAITWAVSHVRLQ